MDRQNQASTPAVKPALIGLNDLFLGTWRFWQKHLKKLVVISAVMSAPSLVGQLISLQQGDDISRTAGTIVVVLAVLSIFVSILGSIVLIQYAKQPTPGRSISALFREAGKGFWAYLLIAVLAGLAGLVGFLFLIIPGVVVVIYFSLAIYIFVDKGLRGTEALRASYHLVKDYWWATFGRLAVLWIVLIAISLVLNIFVEVPLAGVWINFILINVFYILMTPYSTVYAFNLYRSIKEIKGLEANKQEHTPSRLESGRPSSHSAKAPRDK